MRLTERGGLRALVARQREGFRFSDVDRDMSSVQFDVDSCRGVENQAFGC